MSGDSLAAFMAQLEAQLGGLLGVEIGDAQIPPAEAATIATADRVGTYLPQIVEAVNLIDTEGIIDAIGAENYQEIIDALGLINVEDIVIAIGEQNFSEIVNALGVLPFVELVEAVGAIPVGDIVNAIGAQPFADIVDALGVQPFADIVAAIQSQPFPELIASTDIGPIVDAIGMQPFAELVSAITGQPIAEIIAALSPLNGVRVALGDENGLQIQKLNVIRDRLTRIRDETIGTASDLAAIRAVSEADRIDAPTSLAAMLATAEASEMIAVTSGSILSTSQAILAELRAINAPPAGAQAAAGASLFAGGDDPSFALMSFAGLQVDPSSYSGVSYGGDDGKASADAQRASNALLSRIAEQAEAQTNMVATWQAQESRRSDARHAETSRRLGLLESRRNDGRTVRN